MKRIGEFKREIEQIYTNENVQELHDKVDREYVPYLREQAANVHLVDALLQSK